MDAQVSCMKRLSLQLCQRGTGEGHGGKQEGIASQYMLLHRKYLRASISGENSKRKYYYKKITRPEADLFAKWKWMIEPYPCAVVRIAITTVGSFISVMTRCPSQTSQET